MRRAASSIVALLVVCSLVTADTIVMPTGLQFPDGTTQTTAGSPLGHNHLGQTWSGPAGLSVTGTGLGSFGVAGRTGALDIASSGLFGDVTNINAQGAGVWGRTPSVHIDSVGVFGEITNSNSEGVAVWGHNASNNANSAAVVATAGSDSSYNGSGDAILAGAWGNGNAIWAVASEPTATAGRFSGNVVVTGILTKGGGSFKIDHPLDPTNKYLYHSFVESPDMKNIYDGVVTLDDVGEAIVELPEWFEALNRDFRYQLTAVGAPSPEIHIAEKISGNRFRIAGGTPRAEVSWQVTGIRQDAFANANRIPVEQVKAERERGSYLHPAAFGLPDPLALRLATSTSRGVRPSRPRKRDY